MSHNSRLHFPSSEAQARLQLGRGICPCLLCFLSHSLSYYPLVLHAKNGK